MQARPKALALALTLLLTLGLFAPPVAGSEDSPAGPRDVVERYHRSLAAGDAAAVRDQLSDEFVMLNGDFSDDPTAWQAHLFRAGAGIDRWVDDFVHSAGPHANVYELLSTDIREGAAIVVTTETGSNKFRSWRDERVVYLLGRKPGGWKILGIYVRDLRNPE